MPSCILRVAGSTAKVRKFLTTSTVQPARVFWKGEPRNSKSRDLVVVSGFNIHLSSADGIAAQAAKAIKFIRKHKDDLLLIRSLGLSTATIDFALHDLTTEEHPWPSYRIPAALVQLAGELGCTIDLSFYGSPPDAP
jgi:hypothetical protein